jgi:predicted metal-binding membrane protein
LDFLLFHWREGALGALTSGIGHGAYCLGCCWMLMALLFVGGLMNVLWIAGLAILVLIEKIVPAKRLIPHMLGLVLVAAGLIFLYRTVV